MNAVMSEIGSRIPPHDLSAEIAVLGGVLLDNEMMREVDHLTRDTFYREGHRRLWDAMLLLHRAGTPLDVITINDALGPQGMESIGGLTYLAGLPDQVPTALYTEIYSKILEDKHSMRRLISGAGELMAQCYNPTGTLEDILNTASKLSGLVETGDTTIQSFDEVADDALETIFRWADQGGNTDAMKTGFTDLDNALVGLERGTLNVLGGRPAMGKTGLALQIAYNMAKASHGVVVCSLEMRARMLEIRSLSSRAEVQLELIRRGNLSEFQREKLKAAREKLRGLPLHYADKTDMTVQAIAREARRLHAKGKLDVLVIDYLQLVSSSGKGGNREQEVADIARSLKRLALELDIAILALSQLSRAVESRPNHRPMLSDLRESGSIEQDADMVMFVYRDEYYDPKSEDAGTAEVLIPKNRNGPPGVVKLSFSADFVRFGNLAI